MKITTKPNKVLNPAYRKINITRSQINGFKTVLTECLEHIKINEERKESEENVKKYIGEFLQKSFYQEHLINTKERIDLAVYLGKDANSNIGVLIEAKRPSNTSEFLSPDNLNRKALQELLLYYLKERVTGNNNQIKHLIATNGFEWYLFNGEDFYNYFYKNKKLLKEYNEFISGQKDSSKNELFYNEIAKKYIEEVQQELPFLYINIRDFEKLLPLDNTEDDKLVALYKVFSPIHLLGQSYGNDSNQLNKQFYYELLHIIGLEEVKDGGKKVIQRKSKETRNNGSLLESTIFTLDEKDYLRKVDNLRSFGANREEQLFNVGLELCLTWINRVLFLKLLESQLLAYHNGDQKYKFLQNNFVKGFDELEELFFSALAKKPEDRSERLKEKYQLIPYLNSSLFEPNELEDKALQISNVKDLDLELYEKTILKNNLKRQTGSLNTLEYLFNFLEAYDFSADDGEKVDESNQQKSLISASVLGLIFEKINGYKDGSFYTPAYITMYMSREALRRAVVQKFNAQYQWNCKDFDQLQEDLKDYIRTGDREAIRKEANQIINTLKICDPAVGSGHFLVSCLNELIAIKAALNILIDKEGKRLNAYIQLDNDELIIEDENEDLFVYKPNNKASQRIQETLFHEKQTLIENCLFGVDINPNSVKICRLRLWIELLKNAYYVSPDGGKEGGLGQLQTLPNIDINIKTGNSLISRFELDDNLKTAFKSKSNPYSLEDYKNAVNEYKQTNDKQRKRDILNIISTIKSAFKDTLDSKFIKKLAAARGKYEQKQTEIQNLEAFGENVSKKEKDELKKLKEALTKAENEKEEILDNAIYQNAFEWRFEFPEVLDENGDYLGFDVVIGNPPWGAKIEPNIQDKIKESNGDIIVRMTDSFMYFVNLSFTIRKQSGYTGLIIPDVILYQVDNKKLREKILQTSDLDIVINLGDGVFDDVACPSAILLFHKRKGMERKTLIANRNSNNENLHKCNFIKIDTSLYEKAPNSSFPTKNLGGYGLLDKFEFNKLEDLIDEDGIQRGISPDYKAAFIVDDEISKNSNLEIEYIKPTVTGGKDVKKYYILNTNKRIIYTTSKVIESSIPNIIKYIEQYKEKITCTEVKQGKHPFYALHRARSQSIFDKKEKLLGVITGDRVIVAIDKAQIYPTDGLYVFSVNDKISNICLLAILNSTFVTYLYRLFSQEVGRTLSQIKPTVLQEIPIPIPSEKETNDITELVNQILAAKATNPEADTNEWEREIDVLVYRLYGLSYEEVLVVSPDFGEWMGEGEYDKV